MPYHRLTLLALALASLALVPGGALAQSCRASAIIENQCIWFVLDELGGDRRAARQAEHAATSTLIDGCTQGEYQMVLLRGTHVTGNVTQQLRGRNTKDASVVRTACAAAAARAGGS